MTEEKTCYNCGNKNCNDQIKCWCEIPKYTEEDYIKAFKDGAEFGYNKANEWHYPSKGEYPIDKTEMLVYFKYADYEYPCKTFGFYNGHFWDTKRGDVSNKEVIAWKEIVLPKEK
jgi:hypothetical protein